MQMDRRTFLRTTLGAAGGVLLYGCTDTDTDPAGPGRTTVATADVTRPVPRPTLRLPGEVFGFPSPFAYTAGPGYIQMSYLYDTLLWWDSGNQLLPWLASRYERSPDGLTHTFELRDGVRWHDGRPLTPDDVVFTYDYFAKQFLSGLVLAQPRDVASVTATGGRNVQIRLNKPVVTFAEAVAAFVPIVPRHIWEPVADPAQAQDLKLLVGSGPYRLESLDESSGAMLYTANDGYFLGRPFVKRIEIRPVGDPLTALRAGEVDAASLPVQGVGPDALAGFRADPSFGVIEQPTGFTFPLYWNLAKGGALGDVRFRQACAKAIDRADIVRRLLQGNGVPGNPGFLPPGHPFHVPVEQYSFDVAAANRMLDEAGYTRSGATRQGPDGRPLRFGLLFSNTGPPALAELVAAALRGIGVEVTPELVDPVRLFGTKGGGAYDMAVTIFPGPSGFGPNSDPDVLRRVYSSNPFVRGLNSVDGYNNSEMEQLTQQQQVTTDEAERRRLVGRIQEIAARDVPTLPLYYSTLYFAFKKPVFDQWAFFPRSAPLNDAYNKQTFVTGLKTGVEIRPTQGGS